MARWLQSSWKLSRAMGVANIAVLHRLSDLGSVGAAGSEQVGLAEGLLADSETRVVYAQSPGEVARTGELLGLTATEADLVSTLSALRVSAGCDRGEQLPVRLAGVEE